ncbi:MAG: hypothetical protein K2N48_10510 [Muribaculaceae bacterium]|nr:hypothetical protein [Muribaculaceae bacterium]
MTLEEVADLVGRYCIIFDNLSNRSVARGKVLKVKLNPVPCVSFDNIHFFSLDEDNLVDYRIIPPMEAEGMGAGLSLPPYWKKGPWRNKAENPDQVKDVYIEQNFIDPEILDLVLTINRIPNVSTGGSCWGHVVKPAFVTLICRDFAGLNFLLRCQNDFSDRWRITTDPVTSPNVTKFINSLTLLSVNRGDKVCEDIKDLTKHIQDKGREIGILRVGLKEEDFFLHLE